MVSAGVGSGLSWWGHSAILRARRAGGLRWAKDRPSKMQITHPGTASARHFLAQRLIEPYVLA